MAKYELSTEKYDGVVRAAMKGESALWEIGDEIIKAIGPASVYAGASRVGKQTKDGSREKLRDIGGELQAVGIQQYNVTTLADFRVTATSFGTKDRIPGVAFSTHKVAGSPEDLAAAIAYANHVGKKVSPDFVRDFKNKIRSEDKIARKEAYKDAIAAKKEAEAEAAEAREEKRRANSKEAKEAAARKEQEAKERAKEAAALAKDLKNPPPVNHSAPKKGPADTPMLVVRTAFSANIEKVKAIAERMNKDIEPHLENLSDAFVANAVEELLEIAESFRRLSNKVRSGKVNKRAHLYAVGE